MYQRTYTQIGTVQYVFNARAKRIILKVKSDGNVWVTMPQYSKLEKAEDFLLSRVSWVIQAQQKVAKKQPKAIYIENDEFVTHFHKLIFSSTTDVFVSGKVKNKIIEIFVPNSFEISSVEVQECVQQHIVKALRIEAKSFLPNRLFELAAKFNFKYESIRITSAKTRWGSCSSRNRINFTLYIMRLPIHLIDHIILHELCHTVHKNHGSKFHALLDRCCNGDKKEHERELKNYTIH